MDEARMESIEKRQEQILAMLERLEFGLLWFLDPMPDDDEPRPRPRKAKKQNDFGDPKRLRKLRPRAWKSGCDARESGRTKADNPYRDTRGGFRNAWFNGWMERDEELAGESDE